MLVDTGSILVNDRESGCRPPNITNITNKSTATVAAIST
jgi:hypothetical protein